MPARPLAVIGGRRRPVVALEAVGRLHSAGPVRPADSTPSPRSQEVLAAEPGQILD